MKTKFFLLGILLLLSGTMFAQTVDSNYVDGVVYIKFKASRTPKFSTVDPANKKVLTSEIQTLKNISPRFALQKEATSMRFFENPVLASTIRVKINNIFLIDEFIKELSQNPDIEYVEKEPRYSICSFTPPNDPYYGNMNSQNLKWHLDIINAEGAWALQAGKKSIKVAIIDNAVWGEHPDLQIPTSLQYSTGRQDTGSSKPPYSNQDENCTDASKCPAFKWSHGTHCAGNVGAINNNGVGIASIGSGVTLMGVSCPSSTDPGSLTSPMLGVQWAAENGAKVISMSWGTGASSTTNAQIFKSCAEKGIILVAAAGNDNISSNFFPAAYPDVIGVASIDFDKKLSSFSNFGDWVDIAGPGGSGSTSSGGKSRFNSMFSTTFCKNVLYRTNGMTGLTGEYYDGMVGTSMACPVVAGLCGLLASSDSTLTVPKIRGILQQSSSPLAPSPKKINPGVGYINAEKALLLAKSNLKTVENPIFEKGKSSISITWEAPIGTSETIKAYKILKNGEVLDSTIQGLKYIDSNLSKGNFNYSISAIYENSGEGLRYCEKISLDDFFTVSLNVYPEGAGKVLGAGSFERKSSTTIEAIPNPGYTFINWDEDNELISNSPNHTFSVIRNVSYTANFKYNTSNQEEKNSQNFSVFPNPAQNLINIESDLEKFDAIYILNNLGATVKELGTTNANQAIDITSLQAGVYILIAHTNGKTLQARFTKLKN